MLNNYEASHITIIKHKCSSFVVMFLNNSLYPSGGVFLYHIFITFEEWFSYTARFHKVFFIGFEPSLPFLYSDQYSLYMLQLYLQQLTKQIYTIAPEIIIMLAKQVKNVWSKECSQFFVI